MSHLNPPPPSPLTDQGDAPTTATEELNVLRDLVDLLENMDVKARSRAVAYLYDRYNDRSPW
jgi:hypothetical protein